MPSEILGPQGVITLHQRSLESLTLTTDPTCDRGHFNNIYLSPFRELRSLCWKAPSIGSLHPLSVVIRSNSAHLQELDLDFVNWEELRRLLGYDGDKEEGENYFPDTILQLPTHSHQPYFPNIRILSLSQVPLTAAMASAINFPALVSLTLRDCPNWDKFLERVLEQKQPIRLRTLEIQYTPESLKEYQTLVVNQFLAAFDGLEELFIREPGPLDSLEFWDLVAGHRKTLKRFANHQRTRYTGDGIHYDYDSRDMGVSKPNLYQFREGRRLNPLTKLDLECIGLSCVPEVLVSIDISNLGFSTN